MRSFTSGAKTGSAARWRPPDGTVCGGEPFGVFLEQPGRLHFGHRWLHAGVGPAGGAEERFPGAELQVQGCDLLQVHSAAEEPGGPAGPGPAWCYDPGCG